MNLRVRAAGCPAPGDASNATVNVTRCANTQNNRC